MPAESRYLKWLTVPHGGELRVIAVGEICYLQADRKYTTLATARDSFLMSASLGQMKEKLDPQMFWQVHRSVIVNVGAIDTIYRSFRGRLEVKLKGRGELLPVERSACAPVPRIALANAALLGDPDEPAVALLEPAKPGKGEVHGVDALPAGCSLRQQCVAARGGSGLVPIEAVGPVGLLHRDHEVVRTVADVKQR